VLTERLIKVPRSTVLRNLAAEIWPNDPLVTPQSARILKNVASAAQKALRRVRRYAVKEREKFLNELKAHLAMHMSLANTDVDAAIRNIDRQLVDSRRFQRISQALKPTANVTMTKVEIVTTASHLHPTTGETVTQRTGKPLKALLSKETVVTLPKRRARRLQQTPPPGSVVVMIIM
jgi:hypothetical protein